MEFRKKEYKTPSPEKVIWVTGDPIQDVWSTGYRDTRKRWISLHSEEFPGGAANTYYNASNIGYSSQNYVFSQMRDVYPELIRLVGKDGKLDTEMWSHRGPLTKMCRLPSNIMRTDRHRYVPAGLVISEYNKGSCNKPTKRSLPDFEFAVVDSRYRTLDMSWLRTTKTKVWHATGNEYNPDWANNFDYVIWTNGEKPVNVSVHRDGKIPFAHKHLHVPSTEVVDTVGAGDTLTAAVSVWLLHVVKTKTEITFDDILHATEFAIWCCQDVITRKYTSICKRTLKQYLEL